MQVVILDTDWLIIADNWIGQLQAEQHQVFCVRNASELKSAVQRGLTPQIVFADPALESSNLAQKWVSFVGEMKEICQQCPFIIMTVGPMEAIHDEVLEALVRREILVLHKPICATDILDCIQAMQRGWTYERMVSKLSNILRPQPPTS